MKKSSAAILSISLLAIASVAAYGVFTINSAITPAKPAQEVQVTNYSAEIDTLKPQISSLSNNITSLGTVKTDISDIKGKLSDLETKINQAQQDATTPQKPVMVLDKYSYYQGDTIHITASGLDPQKVVQIQLINNYGFAVIQKNASADYAGMASSDMQISDAMTPGNFQVRLLTASQTVSIPITIMSLNYSGSVTLSGLSYLFTAHTDKTIYQTNDIIKVSGIGAPNTSVTGVLTSPSGRTILSNTTIQPDGTFDLFYADSQPFETGNWHVTLHNQGLDRVLYLSITSSSLNALTAESSKSIYQAGDLIWITGAGVPYSSVDAVLTSPSGIAYDTTVTTSSSGSYIVSFATSSGYETGNWYVTLTNQGQSRQVSIFLESSSSSSDSNAFTAQTDKTIYNKGDQIKISGSGKPYTAVRAIMTSPSGKTYDAAVSTGLTGSYGITYSTLPTYETGNWYITLTNQFMSHVVSIYLQSTG